MSTDYTACEICGVGKISTSIETGAVACNVRFFQAEQFMVWRCAKCRTLHCKEDIDFGHYYDHYPLSEQRIQYMTRRSYFNRLRILKRSGMQPSHRILDFGCGGGLFLRFLNSQGYANAVGHDPFVAQYADREPLRQKFDIVYSFGVVEHVPDPRQFFQEQRSLVADSGLVVVATPNADGLRIDRPNSLLFHQPYHRHILSSAAMRDLAEDCGLRIIRHERRNWLDTMHPGLNSQFVAKYIDACGGCVDALFEKKRAGAVLARPSLWWAFWFGYLHCVDDYMICTFEVASQLQ